MLSLNTVKDTTLTIQQELLRSRPPRRRLNEWFVKLRSDLSEFRKLRPRNIREVMVFVVVADVEGEEVPKAVVGEGFLALGGGPNGVVLRDEVTRSGRGRAGESKREREEDECVGTPEAVPDIIAAQDDNPVHHVLEAHRLEHDDHGTESIEEDLEGDEEETTGEGVEEPQLESSGEIGIDIVPSEIAVVVGVVVTEHHGVREDDGDVGNHSEEGVQPGCLEDGVVSDFMDGKEEGVSHHCTAEVGHGNEDGPASIAEED